MNNDLMFSSKTDEWYTPLDFYEQLDEEFHFNLDPCATDENHKCEKYFTKETDGLLQKWGGGACFATLHMDELLESGLRRLIRNQNNLILWL